MKRTALAVIGALFLACASVAHADDATAPGAQPELKVPQAEIEKLLAAYAMIKQNYVGETDDRTLFDGALAGMLAALDAHSRYLDKDAMRDVGRESSGEYVGIGIEVEGGVPERLATAMKSDMAAMSKVIRDAGITAE